RRIESVPTAGTIAADRRAPSRRNSAGASGANGAGRANGANRAPSHSSHMRTPRTSRTSRTFRTFRSFPMIWIAVDAMGGDFAPRHVVDGALAAARHFDLGVTLAGPIDRLEAELARHADVDRGRVRLVAAADVIAMKDAPSSAL